MTCKKVITPIAIEAVSAGVGFKVCALQWINNVLLFITSRKMKNLTTSMVSTYIECPIVRLGKYFGKKQKRLTVTQSLSL